MTYSKETALNKIRKLIALANNNPSANEAQEAMTRARRMMVEHNVEMSEAEAPVDDIMVASSQRYISSPWKRKMAFIVARRFRCKMFYMSRLGKQRVCFMGHASDAEASMEMYTFAISHIDRLATSYSRKMGTQKGDWIYGFIHGLEDAFDAQDASWGMALVAVSAAPADVVDAYEELTKTGKVVELRTDILAEGDSNAIRNGYSAGREYGSGRALAGGA